MPNYDKISQFTSDKTTSGFGKRTVAISILFPSHPFYFRFWFWRIRHAYDVLDVIGMSFCIWLPNFVVIRRSLAEL